MGTFLQHKANKESGAKEYFQVSLKLSERKLSTRADTHDHFIAFPVKVIFFLHKCVVGTNIIGLIYHHCHY